LPPRFQAVAVGVAGADGDRGKAGGARELGIAGEPVGAGDLADELGRGQRTEPGLAEQPRRDLSDLGLQRLDRVRGLADAAQLVTGDANAHRLLGAREPPGDAGAPGAVEPASCRAAAVRARGRADAIAACC
jgi:hypothetical protein